MRDPLGIRDLARISVAVKFFILVPGVESILGSEEL